MSKSPKRPSQRDDLNRRDEGGAPRTRSSHRKPRAAPKREVDIVVGSLSPTGPGNVMDVSADNTLSSLAQVPGDASTNALGSFEEGDRTKRDLQNSHSGVGDGADHEKPIPLAEIANREESVQSEESSLTQSNFSIDDQAHRERGTTPHHPLVHEIRPDVSRDTPSHAEPEERAGHATGAKLRKIGVWQTPETDESTNPLYILAAITLGIPAIILSLLVGTNPAVEGGTIMTLVTMLVLSAVVIAVVFEIKRLADQPSEADHH